MELSTIYLLCLGVGLLFTIVSALMGHIFGGHDGLGDAGGHFESGFGGHDMPSFSAISPASISAFITAFGGVGLILTRIKATSDPWINVPLSMLAAFGIAAGVVFVFRSFIHATQSSSESRVSGVVGLSATIITPIPANGVGEIAYVHGGSRYSAPAREEDGTPLPGGSTVKITRVVGTQFYVRLS